MYFVFFNLIILFILILGIYLLLQGAIFVPSKDKSIKTILEFAKAKKGQRMADLGSGDGRIIIAFGRSGIQADGYEINPILVLISRIRIKKLGLEKFAKVYWRSYWGADLSIYNVVTVFGIDYIMKRLEKKLFGGMNPGNKIIVNLFPFPNKKYKIKKRGVYLYEV